MVSEYISTKPRDGFRGNITFHKHALDVFPSAELCDAPIWQVGEAVAGELRVVGEKACQRRFKIDTDFLRAAI